MGVITLRDMNMMILRKTFKTIDDKTAIATF